VNAYTAQQVADLLRADDPQMNLRTVRYYTQIGLVPPLETIGNRRAYTDVHLQYFRAIMTMSRSGERLSDIQSRLKELPIEEIAKLGRKLPLYQAGRMLEYETHVVDDGVIVSVSDRVSPERKSRILDAVGAIMKEGEPR